MGNHSKKDCDTSINVVEMALICVILFFFFDLLIIDKSPAKPTIIKILTGEE
jgi:hypothetical protein|tara:strand:- start:211 stop:366 length:156 start_codon:yes stop_codon:yes gene_type:complete